MAADWTAIKLAYVNGGMSMRELAQRFDVGAAGLMKSAAKEGWEAERQQNSAKVSNAAQMLINEERPSELAAFNQGDLQLSKALRAMVAKQISSAQQENAPKLSATDLRALAGTAEVAQRMGRLALGANTENVGHAGIAGHPIEVTSIPVEVYLEARAKVVDAY